MFRRLRIGELGLRDLFMQCTDGNRYGDDGTWSAVSIRVGAPQQWVDAFVSTVSSETWVVGPGGCGAAGELPFHLNGVPPHFGIAMMQRNLSLSRD